MAPSHRTFRNDRREPSLFIGLGVCGFLAAGRRGFQCCLEVDTAYHGWF